MKKRALAIIAGLFALTGILLAQTHVEVVIEYNAGVRCLNNQAYDSAFIYFNNTVALAEQAGDEESLAMISTAREQLIMANYSQANTLYKRKQYGESVGFYEEVVRLSEEFAMKEDVAAKAKRFILQASMRAGQAEYKRQAYEESLNYYQKVLDMNPNIYQAHQGIGLVYEKMDRPQDMLDEFAIAREKAAEKGDQKVIDAVNTKINAYFYGLIEEEKLMIDPEEADYSYLLDICNQAIEANDQNAWAYYNAAYAKNKEILFDDAIDYALKGLDCVGDDAMISSALNYELGYAYQNSVMYKEACEAYNKVTEEPFFTKAERQMMTANCQ